MNYQKFTQAVESLREAYGDRAYPDARVRKIWDWARKANEDLFNATIETAIGDCERAPMLSKLKEIYSELRSKNPRADKINCVYCDGTGFIMDASILPTAFACRCDAGLRLPLTITRWRGPFTRIVPRSDELMRPVIQEKFKQTINKVLTKVTAPDEDEL